MSSRHAPTIKPDFDTDVLWKPPISGRKMSRGISIESNDSEAGRRVSVSEVTGTSEGHYDAHPRRMSFTEMIFGSPGSGGRGFSWSERSAMKDKEVDKETGKTSVTEDSRFKEFMRHQNRVLNDEGSFSGFKLSDYRKSE